MEKNAKKKTVRIVGDEELGTICGGAEDQNWRALMKADSDNAHAGNHLVSAFIDGYLRGAGYRY